jgi:hypothetical protein
MDVFDALGKSEEARMFDFPSVEKFHCLFKQSLCHTLVPQVWMDS